MAGPEVQAPDSRLRSRSSESELPPGRLPPQNLDAERAVLAAMLLQQSAIDKVEEILDDSAFYRESHRKVFRAINALSARNESSDLLTVTEELRRQGGLDAIGGATFLQSLLDSAVPTSNVEFHARLVEEKAALRMLINTASDMTASAYEASGSWQEILDAAERQIFSISQAKLKKDFSSLKDALKSAFAVIERLYENKSAVTGIATGYDDLDRMTSGLQPAELIVIAGRPSMGKTSLMLNIAENVAVRSKIPVGVFSLEMSKERIVQRFLCSAARIPAQRLRTGYLKESEWPILTQAAAKLSEAPIYIDDSPAVGLMEMRAKARRLKARNGLGLLCIDYLQLAKGTQSPESRQHEISQISQGLKALAKELDIPVIAGSQLSRAVEARENRRPILSDLRESGAIEQDADLVMFIYREEMYKPDNEDVKGKAELIIGKHRNGPTGTIPLAFLNEYTRFESLASVGDDYFSA